MLPLALMPLPTSARGTTLTAVHLVLREANSSILGITRNVQAPINYWHHLAAAEPFGGEE